MGPNLKEFGDLAFVFNFNKWTNKLTKTNTKAGIKFIRNKTTYWNKHDLYYMLNSMTVLAVSNYVTISLKPV